MKISQACNAMLTIQANTAKPGDYQAAVAIANKMVEINSDWLVLCSECEYEQWIQVSACWDNKQAADLRYAYKEAKKAI